MKKRLYIRLSSLGDVILATAALDRDEPSGISSAYENHWLVAREWACILEGHPKIARVWPFDRGSGLRGWRHLARQLESQGFNEVIDLHRHLRTRLLRLFFFWDAWRFGRRVPYWLTFKKPRLRTWGLFLFKGFWPSSLMPPSVLSRVRAAAGVGASARPNLKFLLEENPLPPEIQALGDRPYFCVMPASHWPGKEWPVERFAAVCAQWSRQAVPVVLGSAQDRASFALCESLAAGVPISGVGRWDLKTVAAVLSAARVSLSNDTGIGHLSEAMGTPAIMVFGPTTPQMGFAPWRPESAAVGVPLGCRPCGKDGRRCYRPVRKYLCLTTLSVEAVQTRGAAFLSARSHREERQ